MILCLSVSHKKANVPVLESLTFKDGREDMKKMCRLAFVEESVLIQTCNRVEIYVVTSDVSTKEAVEQLVGFWSWNVGVSRDVLFRIIEIFEGHEALRHLMFLVAGFESMVFGEDQILGQVRDAYVEAKRIGTAKSFFETIFMKSINVGRRIRTETGINQGSVSISSVAVDLAEKVFGDLKSVRVLLIGAGEAGTLAGKELSKRGVRNVLVANRTYERGVKLAKMIGGKSVRYENINNYIPKVNLVIVAVSASNPVLTLKNMKSVTNDFVEPFKLLILDISQPRCVEEAVGSLPGVNLKTIDDLRYVVEKNLKKRLDEGERAKVIVLQELGHLEKLLKIIVAEPTITDLCRKMERIRVKEISKALRMIRGISDDQRTIIEDLTRELTERILQFPIESLKNAALNGDDWLLSAAQKLFNLETNRK